jgi:hypothetical protein
VNANSSRSILSCNERSGDWPEVGVSFRRIPYLLKADHKATDPGYAEAEQEKSELDAWQTHWIYWLDRQTDALVVGLGFKGPGSRYNDKIKG